MKMKFEDVWAFVKDYVRGYAFKQCSRDPEDPISKTMYALWVAVEANRINDMEHAKAYALRSIHCEVARWWSNLNRRTEITEAYLELAPTEAPSSAASNVDLNELLEDLAALQAMILEVAGNLSITHQKVMACKYEGLSQRETARLCDTSPMTVNRKLKEVEEAAIKQLN